MFLRLLEMEIQHSKVKLSKSQNSQKNSLISWIDDSIMTISIEFTQCENKFLLTNLSILRYKRNQGICDFDNLTLECCISTSRSRRNMLLVFLEFLGHKEFMFKKSCQKLQPSLRN